MELRSAERPQGRARVPREFSRLDTRSPTQSAAIQLFNTVLFSTGFSLRHNGPTSPAKATLG